MRVKWFEKLSANNYGSLPSHNPFFLQPYSREDFHNEPNVRFLEVIRDGWPHVFVQTTRKVKVHPSSPGTSNEVLGEACDWAYGRVRLVLPLQYRYSPPSLVQALTPPCEQASRGCLGLSYVSRGKQGGKQEGGGGGINFPFETPSWKPQVRFTSIFPFGLFLERVSPLKIRFEFSRVGMVRPLIFFTAHRVKWEDFRKSGKSEKSGQSEKI